MDCDSMAACAALANSEAANSLTDRHIRIAASSIVCFNGIGIRTVSRSTFADLGRDIVVMDLSRSRYAPRTDLENCLPGVSWRQPGSFDNTKELKREPERQTHP